eukprot:CAMPEP_0204370008 /NCGR_PEP_ID=MMETSP0469-20131031/45399_1 /ASSEMBLY_ACC=CAM_ASM_000384 /TAXON_ID=2969 /ORGANISM="Oxyrrhis marina" /LENGTH=360 /DNA_ID=CAMNT_0051359851 /DNA_START=147 /DNA_END=1230 /DNA_ORIENTATION=+
MRAQPDAHGNQDPCDVLEDHAKPNSSPESDAGSDPGVSLLLYSNPEGWESSATQRRSSAVGASAPTSAIPSTRFSHAIHPVWTPLADAGWVPPSHGPCTEQSMWLLDESASRVRERSHAFDNNASVSRRCDSAANQPCPLPCAARAQQDIPSKKDVEFADLAPIASRATAAQSVLAHDNLAPSMVAPKKRRSRAPGRAQKPRTGLVGAGTGFSISCSTSGAAPDPDEGDLVIAANIGPEVQGSAGHDQVRSPAPTTRAACRQPTKNEPELVKAELGVLPRSRLLQRRSSGAQRGCQGWPKTRLGFEMSPSLTKPSRTVMTSELIALSVEDFGDTPQFDSPSWYHAVVPLRALGRPRDGSP